PSPIDDHDNVARGYQSAGKRAGLFLCQYFLTEAHIAVGMTPATKRDCVRRKSRRRGLPSCALVLEEKEPENPSVSLLVLHALGVLLLMALVCFLDRMRPCDVLVFRCHLREQTVVVVKNVELTL